MTYTPQTWHDNDPSTPATAARMGVIESGIQNAYGAPAALTGATAATRYVGGTTSGAPVSGTFAVGDYVVDQTGKVWVCTSPGSPGTWAVTGGGGGAGSDTTAVHYLHTKLTQ